MILLCSIAEISPVFRQKCQTVLDQLIEYWSTFTIGSPISFAEILFCNFLQQCSSMNQNMVCSHDNSALGGYLFLEL